MKTAASCWTWCGGTPKPQNPGQKIYVAFCRNLNECYLSLDLVFIVARVVSSLEFSKSFRSKFEILWFIDESQTEDNSNEITLSGIVFFIFIVVYDESASVFLGSADVLEAFKIVRVSEDVVTVNAF
jgi:hypothetical protein